MVRRLTRRKRGARGKPAIFITNYKGARRVLKPNSLDKGEKMFRN
jgi:hypothetical protein